ncbi:hypothetical protein AAG906_006616 [Vitis piasezkii]
MARESEKQPMPKAIIVGAAYRLERGGARENLRTPTGSPTGAGLGLDPLAQRLIESWVGDPDSLRKATVPLTIDQNQAIDGKKIRGTLTRDENLNFRAAHWADLHGLLYNALAEDVFLWGHLFLSFSISDDKSCVKVKSKVLETGEIIETVGDLLVAADGCLSAIREHFLPDLQLRYSGYCAWRGVLDFSENENSETIQGMRRAYPDLGKYGYCSPENWNQGKSVTMKVSSDMIEKMHQEAEMAWAPELVRVMKETKEPFLNAIYDCDPLEQIFWDNVVLIGDAAHPTTPHGLRSTNMSVLDAAVLGKCLEKWGVENLSSALEEYQSTRLPVTSKQVLHARRLGRLKQGLILADREPFDPKTASLEDCEELQQKNMPFFADIPLPLNS